MVRCPRAAAAAALLFACLLLLGACPVRGELKEHADAYVVQFLEHERPGLRVKLSCERRGTRLRVASAVFGSVQAGCWAPRGYTAVAAACDGKS